MCNKHPHDRQKNKEVNTDGNLHVQFILDEPKAFLGPMAKYGKFSGVRNYLVMAGKKADDLDGRVGYYGEQLVLLAQTLGLNTCWVGLSYSKVPGTYVLAPRREDSLLYRHRLRRNPGCPTQGQDSGRSEQRQRRHPQMVQ